MLQPETDILIHLELIFHAKTFWLVIILYSLRSGLPIQFSHISRWKHPPPSRPAHILPTTLTSYILPFLQYHLFWNGKAEPSSKWNLEVFLKTLPGCMWQQLIESPPFFLLSARVAPHQTLWSLSSCWCNSISELTPIFVTLRTIDVQAACYSGFSTQAD